MEEIKVGEYVRTRGIIGKLARIEYDKVDVSLKWYVLDRGNYGISYVNKPYIEKHSFNIIDLIEVGDYVNGYKVLYQASCYSYFDTDTCDWIYIKQDNQIKSIVTKEQFKSREYEVK